MTAPIDISPGQLEIVQDILKSHLPAGVHTWAFGSRATWTAKDFSDLDLALQRDEPLDAKTLLNLKTAFEESALPWKVDVIDMNTVTPEFRAIIEAGKVRMDWGKDPYKPVQGQREMKISEIMEFNPTTKIKNSPEKTTVPFIEMAALPIDGRNILNVGKKPVPGSGAKFVDGDTLFARITPCLENGKGGFVSSLGQGVVGRGSTEFIVFRAHQYTDQNFVYYLSRNPEFRQFAIKGMSGSSGRQRVSWQTLADFKTVYLPPMERQTIGEILSSLDDKIEINRRMNETLEAMARAIFKDWFVDFGPTRRKSEGATNPHQILGGLFPDTPDAAEQATKTAALFPANLDNNNLPTGWEVKKIMDCVNRLKVGKLYNQKSVLKFGNVPVLDQGKSGVIGFHNNAPNIQASPNYRVSIFANHTCLQRLLDFDFSTIQNVIPFVGNCLPTEWVHYATLGKQNFEEYRGHWPSFIEHEITVPNMESMNFFTNWIDALLRKISTNNLENKTLANLRDTLLPKLISGEIRLHNTEKEMETMV